MPLGLRLPSGVRGEWGLDSVPDEVDESSLVTPLSSQPLSVSPKVGRIEKYVNEKEDLRNTTPTPELSFCRSPEHSSQYCREDRASYQGTRSLKSLGHFQGLSLRTAKANVSNLR